MKEHLPTPEELGISIPDDLLADKFREGFAHALSGGLISESRHLRKSFRFGYRSAQLALKVLRRRHGILDFPSQGKIKLRAA